MKKLLRLSPLILVVLLFNSCFYLLGEEDETDMITWESAYDPVVLSRIEFEDMVQSQPQRPLVKSGKIYIYENLMFLNDENLGFHVYNYADPANPVKIGFIQIPGATDLSMRNNIIYINQAVDLVTLTYNPQTNSIAVLHRNEHVFPQKTSPDGFPADVSDDEIIINWIPKQ